MVNSVIKNLKDGDASGALGQTKLYWDSEDWLYRDGRWSPLVLSWVVLSNSFQERWEANAFGGIYNILKIETDSKVYYLVGRYPHVGNRHYLQARDPSGDKYNARTLSEAMALAQDDSEKRCRAQVKQAKAESR
jgi:hypothetical protein